MQFFPISDRFHKQIVPPGNQHVVTTESLFTLLAASVVRQLIIADSIKLYQQASLHWRSIDPVQRRPIHADQLVQHLTL
jgi:hypothetical protein